MIKLIRNKNQIGFTLFWGIIGLVIHKEHKVMWNTFAITFRLSKLDFTFSLGMEKINVKDIEKAIKESKNNDAFA